MFKYILLGVILLQATLASAAPFVGPSKKEVLAILKSSFPKKKLPITLGSGEPQAVLNYTDGMWSIRRLVANPKKSAQIHKEQEKEGYYMPEHNFMSLELGDAIVKDKDKASFIRKLEALSWDF